MMMYRIHALAESGKVILSNKLERNKGKGTGPTSSKGKQSKTYFDLETDNGPPMAEVNYLESRGASGAD